MSTKTEYVLDRMGVMAPISLDEVAGRLYEMSELLAWIAEALTREKPRAQELLDGLGTLQLLTQEAELLGDWAYRLTWEGAEVLELAEAAPIGLVSATDAEGELRYEASPRADRARRTLVDPPAVDDAGGQ